MVELFHVAIGLQCGPRVEHGLDDHVAHHPHLRLHVLGELRFGYLQPGGGQVLAADVALPHDGLEFPSSRLADIVLGAVRTQLGLEGPAGVVAVGVDAHGLGDLVGQEVWAIPQQSELVLGHDDALELALHLAERLG